MAASRYTTSCGGSPLHHSIPKELKKPRPVPRMGMGLLLFGTDRGGGIGGHLWIAIAKRALAEADARHLAMSQCG